MTTLIAGTVGLFFLYIGLALLRKHKEFSRNSIRLQGNIIEINKRLHTENGRFGNKRRHLTPRMYPTVQYRYNGKNYQYQADTEINPVVMPKGTLLTVLIEPMRPRAPQLEIGMKNGKFLFGIFAFIGLICLFVAAIDFDLTSFVKEITNPFVIVIAIFIVIFAYFEIAPMLKEMNQTKIYPEHAKEIE